MKNLFYKPDEGVCGDFIPFYDEGEYKLFYIRDFRNPEYGPGMSWHLITTKDFVNFDEKGEALKKGKPEEQDFYVFTGSAIKAQGKYHIFYTGHGPNKRAQGLPEQAIMHAVSDDLINWTKLYDHCFLADDRYETNDWRDPFVFYNEEAGEYWMLLAARLKEGAPHRRLGCTALCTSKDLEKWEIKDPFWAPGLYYTHECPDLFKIGDWWYLIFSEYSQAWVTRYRMSKSINGPWIAPENDTFDGRAYYAAKTATDGKDRYLFGWNPTREGDSDSGNWQWGGSLVVHKIYQKADGSLGVKPADSFDGAFTKPVAPTIQASVGDYKLINEEIKIIAPDTFKCVSFGSEPPKFKLELKFRFYENSREFGIMLRADETMNDAYYIRFEPQKNRVVLDKWKRAGDVSYMMGIEQPIKLKQGDEYSIKLYVEDTVGVVYINDEIALNFRMYDLKTGSYGVFVQDGEVDFELKLFTKIKDVLI